MIKICKLCKIEYKTTGGRRQKFCSRQCFVKDPSFYDRYLKRRSYKGKGNPFYGKKLTNKHKEILRKANLGRKLSFEQILKIKKSLSNENCYAWKGGISPDWWRKRVLERYNFTCQECGLKDREVVEADHIKPKSDNPRLKHNLDNGTVLCANCHRRKTRREHKLRMKRRWKERINN